MSESGADWTALASQNERLTQAAGEPEWAELASQDERLLDASDPLYGLAMSGQHRVQGFRLAATAA